MIVNTRLMSHPINWVIVLLMLLIAGLFGHYLLYLFDQQPAVPRVTANTTPAQMPGVLPE